jgi:hypothetical protein
MNDGRAFMALVNMLAGCFMLWLAFTIGKL